MRPFAILIHSVLSGILAFSVSSCVVQPQSNINAKELARLEGPEPGSIDKNLQQQADQAISNGDFMRAAEMYKQLSDKNPEKKEYTIAFIDNLRKAEKNELAVKAATKALEKYPSDLAIMEIKGLALMNLGEFAEASRVFDQVMKTDDKRWKTLNALGILFAIKKMNPQAIEYYNAALKVSPDNPAVLNNLGLAQAIDRDYATAIETLIRARNHAESGSEELKHVDMDLALVYAIAGRLDDAEVTASPYLSKAALYNNMGFYSYIEKNKELAKVYLNKALVQNPAYYERAWKNLSAVSGDNSSEINADNSPHVDQDAGEHVLNDEEVGTQQTEKPHVVKKKIAKNTVSRKAAKVETVPVEESDAEHPKENKNAESAPELIPPVDVTATPPASAQVQNNKADTTNASDNKEVKGEEKPAQDNSLFSPPPAPAK